MSHNGYKNYETWCVGVWLDSDPWEQSVVRELSEMENKVLAADTLKEYVELHNPITETNLFSDLMEHALQKVDWYELVEREE